MKNLSVESRAAKLIGKLVEEHDYVPKGALNGHGYSSEQLVKAALEDLRYVEIAIDQGDLAEAKRLIQLLKDYIPSIKVAKA